MQSVIPPERRARIDALGYDYAAQPAERVTSCNLCGGPQLVTLTHHDRYRYPARASACAGCGLVFLDPRMTAQAYQQFYNGVYRPLVTAYHGRLIDAKPSRPNSGRTRWTTPKWCGRCRWCGPRTMLDIGGSTGVVAAFAANSGCAGRSSIRPRSKSNRRGPGARHNDGPGGGGLRERRFDLVVMCQTVDHLLDIGGTLAASGTCSPRGGVLFVDIVDFRAAYLRNWSVEAATKIDHPYYLTRETMEAFLRRAGFAIVARGLCRGSPARQLPVPAGRTRCPGLPDPVGGGRL